MNKDVEQHLQELIEFYSNTDIKDIEYLKKLFVRNLKDVQRRYVKYDKPRKEQLNKAIEYIKSIKMVNCKLFDYNGFLKEHLISFEELKKKVEEDGTLEGHFVEVNKDKLLEILGDKENERK